MTDLKIRYEQMLHEMESLVKITNKRSVLILLQHTKQEETEPCIPAVRESISNIIGFVSLGDEQYLPYIIGQAVGIVDTVMIDVDAKRANSEKIRLTATQLAKDNGIAVAYYSDYSTWISSAIAFMLEIEQKNNGIVNYEDKRLLIGRNALATKMVMEMINRGMDVYLFAQEYPTPCFPTTGGTIEIASPHIHIVDELSKTHFNTLIGCELQQNSPYLDQLSNIHFEIIYDLCINNFTREFINQKRENGTQVYRSDDRAGISGIVVNLMETSELVKSRLGKTSIGGIPIVSGGYVGEQGDVVVDNYVDAHTVLGIANGDGTFKQTLTPEDEINLNRIKKLV